MLLSYLTYKGKMCPLWAKITIKMPKSARKTLSKFLVEVY